MPHETTSDNTKQLLAKYAQEITQLKDLFVDWNELDLLSQLEEEAGDIELVIIRITEGHATQWKQQKKQNKKQPIKNFHHDQNYSNPTTNTITATSAFVSSSTFDDDNNNTSFSASRGGRADGNSFTGIRGGRGAARGRGSNRGSGRGAFFNVNNGNELNNEFKYEGSTRGGRGGAIRGRGRGAGRGGRGGSSFNSFAEPAGNSPVKSPEPLPSWDDSAAQSSGWGGESWGDSEVPAVVEKAFEKPKNTERNHNSQKNYKPNASSARPKTTNGTWAQLVKGPDLPSEPVVPKQAKPIAKPVVQQQQQNLAPISAVSAMLPTSPVNLQQQFQQQIKTPTSPVVRSPSPVPRSASPPMKSPSMFQQASPSPKQQQQEPVVIGPPGFKHQRPAQRVLNQDAAVVMPQNANLSSIGVKFGSLSVGQDDTKLDAKSPAQAPSNISGLPHHPQQHPTGLQHFAGVSGFGFSNMQGNLPADYSALYGSDAQRAAMGYYADPSAYVNQAAGAKYPPEGATSTQPPTGSLNSAPQPGTAQQYMPQQQQYYYPYPQQYMQSNQFQQQPAYQSSVYPNQFVNKSMYPYNQPQQPTGSVAGSTAGAQAGAKGSTAGVSAGGYYGVSQPQHMYQQQPQPHHYDDITTTGGGVYGGAQGFGFGGLGLSGAPSASKPQPGQGQDPKNQATRGARQAYDNPQQNASAAATTTASAASSYYNPQQQMPVAGAGGYPFSAMHHGYQQQGQPQPGYSRGQQQGYWNGQS